MTRDCEHGQLARKCLICELSGRLTESEAIIKRALELANAEAAVHTADCRPVSDRAFYEMRDFLRLALDALES